jgi:biotin carboxylase
LSVVLFLGASVSQVAAIRRARALGIRVVVVDGDPDALGFAAADIAVNVDFSDVARVIDVARRHEVGGVVAISTDRAVPVAAAVADALGLPGIGIETADAMTNKATMRRRLAEAGVPQPAFAVLEAGDDLAANLELVGRPAVLKPVDSGGQRGIFVVRSPDELRELWPTTLEHSRTGEAILERYVVGSELNGIAVVSDGEPHLLTLSDRLRPEGPGFGVGWAHQFPSLLGPGLLQRAGEVAIEAIRALGLRDGIAFPQLLLSGDDVFVVEVAARVPAGQMADLVRLGTGVDLVEIALRQALGQPIPAELRSPRFERPLAIRFLTASPGVLPTGRVSAIDGLDEVLAASGVLEAGLYLQLGETINAVHVDADRRGYVIATAENSGAALELADLAARKLRVTVAQAEG